MKILICVHSWAPRIGGVETVTSALAQGLAAHSKARDAESFEVTVVTRTPAGEMNDASLPFRVVREPSLRELVRLMRGADVIHLAGPTLVPLVLGVLLRKPLVIEHHGFQSTCPNGQLLYEPTQTPCPGHFMAGHHRECLRCNAAHGKFRTFRMWALTFPRRWLCRKASINIVPTVWLGTQLQLPRIETVHHGLPETVARANPCPTDTATFAFLGRIVSTKGVQILLEAARRLKAQGSLFRLKIVGDGPDRESLESFVRKHQLGEEVCFLGCLPAEALDRELQQADTVLMPSLGGEVFGLVALENMLRGKLVIVSDLGALAEVVGDAGLTCPTSDVEAWTARLAQVIGNPGLRAELGRKARERALRSFSLEQMVAGHLRLYQRLVNHTE
jgi:glycosyltransferase involved in cell wall biosynthesis